MMSGVLEFEDKQPLETQLRVRATHMPDNKHQIVWSFPPRYQANLVKRLTNARSACPGVNLHQELIEEPIIKSGVLRLVKSHTKDFLGSIVIVEAQFLRGFDNLGS